MKKTVFTIIAILVSHLSFSQIQKLGYVYEDYIMVNFSEVKALQNEISTKKEEFAKQLQVKAKDYQDKYAIYQASLKNVQNITTESLNAILQEVKDLKKGAEDYQANAEAELQATIETKYRVIRGKVDDAIKKTAAEKGYKLVFRRNADANNRESTPILLYSNDNGRDNLSDAVLIKLGSTPPKSNVPPKPAVAPKPKVVPKK